MALPKRNPCARGLRTELAELAEEADMCVCFAACFRLSVWLSAKALDLVTLPRLWMYRGFANLRYHTLNLFQRNA